MPDHRAAPRIKRIEHAIERRDEHPPVDHRHAAIDHVATHAAVDLHVDIGGELPQRLPAGGIEGIDPPGHARGIEHTADLDRRRLQPARGAQIRSPGEAEACDIAWADVGEGGVVRLAGIAAGAGPIDIRRMAACEQQRGEGGRQASHGLGMR